MDYSVRHTVYLPLYTLLFFFFLPFTAPAVDSSQPTSSVSFSQEELEFLGLKQEITMCIDPDWLPLEAIIDGNHVGMTAEYLELFRETIGIPITLIPTDNWKQSLTYAKKRKCDIFSLAMATPDREKYMHFTSPYLNIPLVMATKTATPFVDDIAVIKNRKIGITDGYAFNELLRKRYPEMQIVDVESLNEGLKKVAEGELFGFIGTLATVGYSIQKYFVGELKVSGKFDERWSLGIGARNDEPLLAQIFEKAIASLDPAKQQEILNNWIAVRFEQGRDYSLLWKILPFTLAAILVLLYRNYSLGQYTLKLKEQNKEIQNQAERLRQAEKELNLAKKMESIGLMAGGVAHDLNNILSGIVGYPELILNQLPEDSELRKPIQAIHESGERAAVIVADLLTVARGAASVRENHDLNTLIREYLDSPECEKLKSQHSNVTFLHQFTTTQSQLLCSPVHIKKCLMNLITNAAESVTGSGKVTISTSKTQLTVSNKIHNDLEEGSYIILSIQDTGAGISHKDMAHIFEPFYTKKVMGRSGTGLGLTVVWNTMEDHNGKVLVESDENGTLFQLIFPESEEKVIDQAENKAKNELTGSGEHILIVDDEPQLRNLANEMLRSMGYKVNSVCSGELALDFVKETPVDLIVMDMLMDPGMNGRQSYAKILKLYPDQKAIVASGFSQSDDVKATIKLGANGFIKKPYTMASLGQAVKEALNS
jgi:signal transduction histidine kinase/ActR/RegA family two-component response regulator